MLALILMLPALAIAGTGTSADPYTICASGCDYGTAQLFEDGNGTPTGLVYGQVQDGFANVGTVSFAGTYSESNHLVLRGQTRPGTAWAAGNPTITGTVTATGWADLRDIQVEGTASYVVNWSTNAGGVIERVYMRPGANLTAMFYNRYASSGGTKIVNCVLDGGETYTSTYGLYPRSGAHIYNNTVVGGEKIGTGLFCGAPVFIRNNLITGTATADYSIVACGGAENTTYNLSQDATSTGTGAIASVTVTFAGAGNYDLSPLDASGAATGGLDLSAYLSDDAHAASRSVPWSIGADELNISTSHPILMLNGL